MRTAEIKKFIWKNFCKKHIWVIPVSLKQTCLCPSSPPNSEVQDACLPPGRTSFFCLPRVPCWHFYYHTTFKSLSSSQDKETPTGQELCHKEWRILNTYHTVWKTAPTHLYGRMDGRKEGRMDEWMNGWMDDLQLLMLLPPKVSPCLQKLLLCQLSKWSRKQTTENSRLYHLPVSSMISEEGLKTQGHFFFFQTTEKMGEVIQILQWSHSEKLLVPWLRLHLANSSMTNQWFAYWFSANNQGWAARISPKGKCHDKSAILRKWLIYSLSGVLGMLSSHGEGSPPNPYYWKVLYPNFKDISKPVYKVTIWYT